MATGNSIDYCGSFTEDDSGIGLDYASSSDLNSSTLTLIEPLSPYISQSRISTSLPSPAPAPIPSTITLQKRFDAVPLIKFASDDVVERIRPTTMKNSENGDFILCKTDRGTYVAYRTPVVPQWVTRLVEEIEYRQQ
jgi:hypothetical protein